MSVAGFIWAEAVKVPGEKHVGWDVDEGNGLIIIVDRVVGDEAELSG